MITGHVRATENGSEPVIRVRVAGSSGSETEVEAVVDTGFTGYLTLAPATVENLELTPSGNRDATLADGSVTDFRSYDAEVLWHGHPVPVEVLAVHGTTLVGMEMLLGSELRVRAVPNGQAENRGVGVSWKPNEGEIVGPPAEPPQLDIHPSLGYRPNSNRKCFAR